MEKRVTFNERWLPYLLVGPQILITLVFFFWPSSQAIYQSVLIEDAFGGNTKFVFLDNFIHLFNDPGYYHSARLTVVFSFLVAAVGLAVAIAVGTEPDSELEAFTRSRLGNVLAQNNDNSEGEQPRYLRGMS